jgi:hypothetical protein
VGRFYTTARRHPWVLGRVADWKIPLGPYTPAQITFAVGGGFLLVKTISWWSWMGPVPLVAWFLAIWAVRRPKFAGRSPMHAAAGWVLLGAQPRGGRIGGRAARDRAARVLLGGFTIEDEPAPATDTITDTAPRAVFRRAEARARQPMAGAAVRREAAPRGAACPPSVSHPVSGVQQLMLGLAGRGGGVR